MPLACTLGQHLPLQVSPAQSSSAGLLAFNPLCSKLCNDDGADMSSLERPQGLESHSSFALSYTEQDAEVSKSTERHAGKENARAESSPSPTSGWAPYFNLGSNVDGDAKAATNGSPPGAESRPTTPPEEDVSGTFGREAGENSHTQSRELRSKLRSMLSLAKRVNIVGLPLVAGHSSQFMMEMSGFQLTSFTRRAPMADSKICTAIQKESVARMFDLYDERNIIAAVPGYGAPGGYVSKAADAFDMGVRADLSWMEDQCNDAWGTEPWHSEQQNILMKTLHIMRCDIESLKIMLRSLDLPAARGGPLNPHLHETMGYMPYMHPVMMSSNSGMSEMKQNSCRPSDDEQTENCVDSLKEQKELALTAEKDRNSVGDKDLFVSEVPSPEKDEESEESIRTWSHGCPKKRKQWWRELLAAFGLTVWVITGAVLVAKAIGVPNLGVRNNVAYNGFWGHSDDEETRTPVQGAMGVVELSSYTFHDTITKRPAFVMFYAPWCPHCQRLHPIWTQLADVLSKKGYNVQLAIVDATTHTGLANKYEVPGFPTLIMFKNGVPVGRHRGARDIVTLMSFIDNNK